MRRPSCVPSETALTNYSELEAVLETSRCLHQHGFDGWDVVIDKAISRLGGCHVKKRYITLSSNHIANHPRERVLNTIRHEVAHAIAFRDHNARGHGHAWRAACQVTGADPTPDCTDDLGGAGYRYTALCNKCKAVFYRCRLTKRLLAHASCGRCSTALIWHDNKPVRTERES